ncbi:MULTISPECIES: GntR family transcriptional regulator [Sphaerochaeta]|jgi:GntR family transcriptional regulator|uniref:HTH-type transcriptional repressor YtrA n=1 Tax=bioreactor metagenome TaxID=1076179 RepID=A0A644WP76_9ZZZZ|nr:MULTISPECIES: GntR family transcriptional regulator [Sphaerochaeta]MDT3359097.1 GntR family transcriptional regulator [Spirochaetota bacterium]NLA96941.1 GntR family transcriptional regulator [Spirochaetales bacterium]MDD3424397.1 GntR family transcriptional regulator [Sphaerochaeta sp.]MDD3457465.1 GntR family transcriptional regulator [Sphaerochaeta sp.]MDD4038322.1 GntR family transcriptional regulator [Sphaerochaeta sp.]
MQFNTLSPIYLQIAEYIHDLILNRVWEDGQRIPSVRDMAMELEVNPNTVIRTYAMLQEEGTLENQRGIGYFTAKDARALVLKQRREKFIKRELPQLFSTMETLGITLEDLQHYAHNEEIHHEVQAKEE